MKKFFLFVYLTIFCVVALAYIASPSCTKVNMPVEGATANSYNPKAFWCPWGDHHHGVDIFTKVGTPVHPARAGVVIWITNNNGRGGNTVSIMDYSGTIYYYAHLNTINVVMGDIVTSTSTIGTVGKTGNAANTPAHLHFSMMSI